jgi:hypothetical protein
LGRCRQHPSIVSFRSRSGAVSGNICPDGHPDHYGAWPSDGYYADLDGSWTDVSVNNSASGKDKNQQYSADGKFDQSTFPTSVDLQMGRFDMRNLPLYAKVKLPY